MTSLIDEAIQIAQEHGLRIIACGEDKAPIHKGWRDMATSDPDKIREMFSDPRAKLVGVPAGPINDLLVFDLDYRVGNTDARNDALERFEQLLTMAHDGIRVHRTRNGGKHLIMLNPEGKRKLPRNIMPKLELVFDGFQFIWPTKGSGYEVLGPVALDALEEPDAKFLKVREKMKGISDAGGLMSAELAREVMVSDGEVGTRHDALLRMTYDFVAGAPEEMTPPELCSSFEDQFRAVYEDYIEPTRLEELMHWRWEHGELYGSDLGNAMKGAIERHPQRRAGRMASMERPPSLDLWGPDETPGIEPEASPELSVMEQAQLIADELSEQQRLEDLANFPSGEVPWDEQVEPRQWILSHRIERGEVSVLQGPPGVGKTATVIGWAGVVASGVSFLNERAWGGPKNVVYLNGDDTRSEVLRRLKAFRMKHKNAGSLMPDRLRYLSDRIVLVDEDKAARRRSVIEMAGKVDLLVEKLAEWETDLLIIDPLPSVHEIRESEPGEMQVLMGVLRRIVRLLNIAVVAVQHWKPPVEGEAPLPNPINGMARHVTQMRIMKAAEAEAFGQPAEERHRFLRLWDAKANNEAQAQHAWLKMVPVELENGDDVYAQDKVAVVTRWEPGSDPKMAVHIENAIRLLREEWERPVPDYERNVLSWANSPRWFGQLIVKNLMDGQVLQDGIAKDKVGELERRARTEAQGIINTLSELKLILKVQDVPGSNRAMTWGYHVNEDKFELGLWKNKIK